MKNFRSLKFGAAGAAMLTLSGCFGSHAPPPALGTTAVPKETSECRAYNRAAAKGFNARSAVRSGAVGVGVGVAARGAQELLGLPDGLDKLLGGAAGVIDLTAAQRAHQANLQALANACQVSIEARTGGNVVCETSTRTNTSAGVRNGQAGDFEGKQRYSQRCEGFEGGRDPNRTRQGPTLTN